MNQSIGEQLAALAPNYADDFAARLLGQTMTVGKRRSKEEVLRAPWHVSPYDDIARVLLKEACVQSELVWRCAATIARPGRSAISAMDEALLALERERVCDARRLMRGIARVEAVLLESAPAEPFEAWLIRHTPAMAVYGGPSVELRSDVAETLRHIDWEIHGDVRTAIRRIPTRVADEHELTPVIIELLRIAGTGMLIAPQRTRINLSLWGAITLCRFRHHQRPLQGLQAAWRNLARRALFVA